MHQRIDLGCAFFIEPPELTCGFKRHQGLERDLRVLPRYIFMVFCSHMLTVTVVAAAAGVIGFSPDAPYFPLIWIGQFPLVIIVAVVIQELAQKAQVLPLLTGPRTRT